MYEVLLSAKVNRGRREGDGKQYVMAICNMSRQCPTILRHVRRSAHATEFVMKPHKSIMKGHDDF